MNVWSRIKNLNIRYGYDGLGFIGIAREGHAWVCDGFQSTNSCSYSYLSLHMNWGWGGNEGHYNGWYAAGEFWKPRNTNDNYELSKSMVYNIKP